MSTLARIPRDLGIAARRVYRESGWESRVRAASWITLYIALALVPLAVIAISPPPVRDFLTELSVTLGFIGLAMLGLQFALTARFQRVQAPYGMDVVLQFHRQIALVAFGFVLVHPVLLVIAQPARLPMMNPIEGNISIWLGWAALISLTLLVVTSVWRLRLGLSYEWWRISHGVLAVLGLGFALWHVTEVGWYLGQPWKQGLWAAMGIAVLSLLAWTRVVTPWLLLRRPWIVEEVRSERGGSWSLARRADGRAGMRVPPGPVAWGTLGP
jgi:predicted ferric reductase